MSALRETFAALLRRAALHPETLTAQDWRRLYWDEPCLSPDHAAGDAK